MGLMENVPSYRNTVGCNAKLLIHLYLTFFVMAFGSVPNCGASAGRSTGLLMSDGTDSVLRILATTTEIMVTSQRVHTNVKHTLCPTTAD